MLVSRRLLLSAVPLTAALVSPAACSSGTATDPRSPGDPATDGASLVLDTAAWSHDADNDVYYQLGLSYVTAPQDTAYETLSIFVPGAYMSAGDNGDGTFTASVSEGSVGSWTAATAPVVLPVNTPGYAAQKPLTEYSYDTVSAYMQAGIIYVHAGLRGKDSTTDAAAGNAPWGVVDLKAAVRYLRYNATGLPGGAERVFVFGHSGGGAQSAVMGASGDSALYSPYLETLGAATADADGGALSDAIAGAMCWCPITSLNEANAAYEWNMGQFSSEGTRAPGTWTEAYSKDLAAAYAEHVNTMGLTDAAGTALSLEASETGVCLKGSYYDHLVGVITSSLNAFLATTEFPYTPDTTQMAGMGGGAPGDPDGGAPGGAPSGGAQDGGPSGDQGPGSSQSTGATTYATVEDYIASLNAGTQWVTYDSTTRTATITGLADFVTSQKSPSKDVGALDGVDRGQTENTVLGIGQETRHFSQVSRSVLAAKESRYASLTGWSSDYGAAAYDSDFMTTDSLGIDVLIREQMYNPMHFLGTGAGAGSSTVAPSWRIRTGIQQGDTAGTVEVNLALALATAGHDVDFATVWGQGHTMAEVTGSGEANFIAWLSETAAA